MGGVLLPMRQPSPSFNYVFLRLEWPPLPPRLAQPSSASSPSPRGTLGQTPVLHVYPPGGRRWWPWGLVISNCCQLSRYAVIFSDLSYIFFRKATNQTTFSAAWRLSVTLPVHESNWLNVSNVMVQMVILFLFTIYNSSLVGFYKDHTVRLKTKPSCPFSLQKQVNL